MLMQVLFVCLPAMMPMAPLEALVYIQPFLNVICSEETSGPITGVALSAVHKFLLLGVIRTSSELASPLTH